jgi:hypothetical protein
MVKDVEPSVALKYNKNYIGLARDGVATNFITFRPKKQHILAEFKIPRSDELTRRLQDEGMDPLTYQFGADATVCESIMKTLRNVETCCEGS